MNVVIVDDTEDTVEATTCLLEISGIQAKGFTEASKALAYLKRNKTDLILLDIRMPGKSGPEFCKELRTEGVKTSVVFFTASSEKNAELLKETKALGYIFKPFDKDGLVKEIKSYVASTKNKYK
jgi:DNA-binding response OmpR family regulator